MTHDSTSDMASTTLYEDLGLSRNAEPLIIKAAYRALVKTTHPDIGGDPAAFQRIEEAYRVLIDPESREAYDATLPDASAALPEEPVVTTDRSSHPDMFTELRDLIHNEPILSAREKARYLKNLDQITVKLSHAATDEERNEIWATKVQNFCHRVDGTIKRKSLRPRVLGALRRGWAWLFVGVCLFAILPVDMPVFVEAPFAALFFSLGFGLPAMLFIGIGDRDESIMRKLFVATGYVALFFDEKVIQPTHKAVAIQFRKKTEAFKNRRNSSDSIGDPSSEASVPS